jgi:hypothetical protein
VRRTAKLRTRVPFDAFFAGFFLDGFYRQYPTTPLKPFPAADVVISFDCVSVCPRGRLIIKSEKEDVASFALGNSRGGIAL